MQTAQTPLASKDQSIPLVQLLVCAGLIVTLSMGIRHGFGLWLQPMTQDNDWGREVFSFAMALQNLVWGVCGIFAGMVADRFGAVRVLWLGAMLYAMGLASMAISTSALGLALGAGLLIGTAQAGTTYAIVYGVIGRNIAPEKRSMAMGITAAAGSFGQFLLVPIEQSLISALGWQTALILLGAIALLILPLAWGLREPNISQNAQRREQSITQALSEAFRYPSFLMLMAGYFVCGFQVVFIGIHMPSYLRDHNLAPQVTSYALALIGLFNVLGTYLSGWLGQYLPKRYILSGIYLGRSIVISLFLWAPLTPMSVYLFSAAMGLLWLSTVPATNAAVAGIFGVSHFSMLSGFVFFGHQIGSFLGVWTGGVAYDVFHNYDWVWAASIALGIFAALINLPVNEKPLSRPSAAFA